MEGPPRYPFEILPKEMWEKIILEVRDCQDFQNLMKASEQLNDSFRGIRHLWLLEKVLPLLTTTGKEHRLEFEDVKKLRLVNKPWCRAVNTFLENQPILRPYSKDDDKVNSENHIWDDSCRIFGKYTAPGNVFFKNFDPSLVKKLIASFENPNNNPFIARSLTGFEDREYADNPEDEDEQPFWGIMKNDVFEMFGKHIWSLRMFWGVYGRLLEEEFLWRDIVISLSSLPNINSLELRASYNQLPSISESAAQDLLQSEKGQLPSLPFLESLKMCGFTNVAKPFSQQLVSKYSLQLRRLHISTLDWDSSKEWTLSNLTELCLSVCNESVEVTEILKSLEAPQLAKFQLEAPSNVGGYCKLKMEEEIFLWLTLMPSILHLDIADKYFVVSESGNLEPKQDSKLSLKYLKIYNSAQVNYNFLRCLPNLKRLQICLQDEPVVWDCSAYPEIRIKLELETRSLYQSNVWELCPRLSTLSLCCPQPRHENVFRNRAWQIGKSHDLFDRETYEKLKINPRLDLRKCANLRPGIIDFLRRNEAR